MNEPIRLNQTLLELQHTHPRLGIKGSLFICTSFAMDVSTNELKFVLGYLLSEDSNQPGSAFYIVSRTELDAMFLVVSEDKKEA